MSRKSVRSHAAVERLLEERKQYQEWLATLEAGGAGAVPPSVVERVRGDYENRLTAVTKELARHEGGLELALSEAEKRHEECSLQRAQREEALAEAQLRHQVGEYDDARFAEVTAESRAALKELGEAIAAAERDMARYEGILALIAGAAAVQPQPAAAVQPQPAPDEAAVPPQAAAQLDALDELAFLRSVTGDVAPAESRPPASAHQALAPDRAAPKPPPAPVSTPPAPVETPRASTSARGPEAEGKRLRCAECGTLNFPTEWYCEKCGAELAAF